ncbi:MAG TPA: hypothetical protein VL992_19135 [Tepidisphaeraceae bacterium]|nr:hypothetical protein [Tepidisphaeraceae bacterium]
MKRLTRLFSTSVALLAFSLAGCAISPTGATTQPAPSSDSLRQQLQTAELAFTAAEAIVAALEAGNVISPAESAQIGPAESAAAAALSKAASDVAAGDSTAQASLDALNSAVAAYSQAIAQAKNAQGVNP